MPLTLTTTSRDAFESLTDGLRALDRYYVSRLTPDIDKASEFIDAALSKDANYGLAIYYKGVALDLIGKPADAPAFLNRFLTECDTPALALEARFNLGVAHYHQYSHEHLDCAKSCFDDVIKNARDSALIDIAKAHLAQTHAMWMRPSHTQLSDKRLPVTGELREHIQYHFNACVALVADLRGAKKKESRIIAAYENAYGMANMYYTDHIAREVHLREKHLSIARTALLAAETQLPFDWANTCDLGSVELRLAVLARDRKEPTAAVEIHFARGKNYLLTVIRELRPGYGFALYELGILHCVWGKWQEASDYLRQASEVPQQYRDIADQEIEERRRRIDEHDESYP